MERNLEKQVDALLVKLDSLSIETNFARKSYGTIIEAGFRGDNLVLACAVCRIVMDNKPLTLRSVFYQVVSKGLKPSTDKEHYLAVGRILKRLRRETIIPYSWIVDSLRSTEKPSSWTGLSDYIETIQDSYRKNFWRELPRYVHIITEKDAIAGVLRPITTKYDVSLSPLRGFASDSFVYSIADTWNQIDKPIHVAYLGDFDPSGMNIETDCRNRLQDLCERDFTWTRLGVTANQIKQYGLLPLAPKKRDRRYKQFIEEHGAKCAEVDAIEANELRRMTEEFITNYIPSDEWEHLQRVEALERDTFDKTLAPLRESLVIPSSGHAY
jgi:hypothetical protein